VADKGPSVRIERLREVAKGDLQCTNWGWQKTVGLEQTRLGTFQSASSSETESSLKRPYWTPVIQHKLKQHNGSRPPTLVGQLLSATSSFWIESCALNIGRNGFRFLFRILTERGDYGDIFVHQDCQLRPKANCT
jgi:hypothetical protein